MTRLENPGWVLELLGTFLTYERKYQLAYNKSTKASRVLLNKRLVISAKRLLREANVKHMPSEKASPLLFFLISKFFRAEKKKKTSTP